MEARPPENTRGWGWAEPVPAPGSPGLLPEPSGGCAKDVSSGIDEPCHVNSVHSAVLRTTPPSLRARAGDAFDNLMRCGPTVAVPASGRLGRPHYTNAQSRRQHPMMDSVMPSATPPNCSVPALLIYRGLVRQNLEAMIAMAQGPSGSGRTSRPTRWPRSSGWPSRWASGSTSARPSPRPRWSAAAGGTDVLLSYPLIGPNLKRFANLVRGYRNTTFRATVDHPDSARALSAALEGSTGRSRSSWTWRSAWAGPVSSRASRPPSCTPWLTGCPTWSPTASMPTTARSTTRDVAERRKVTQDGIERTLALRDRLLKRGRTCPRWCWAGRRRSRSTPSWTSPAWNARPGRSCCTTTSYTRNIPTCPSRRPPCC